MTAIKEKPIPFSTQMVKAILKGNKTMTRRVLQPQPLNVPEGAYMDRYNKSDDWCFWLQDNRMVNSVGPNHHTAMWKSPYQVGQRLWVRENWAICSFSANFAEEQQLQVAYRAGVTDTSPNGNTHDLEWRTVDYDTWKKYADMKYYPWHTSRFMPKFASRLFLEITEVFVQRVQEITYQDAICEGHPLGEIYFVNKPNEQQLKIAQISRIEWFRTLWDSFHEKRGFGWNTNPWIWAIRFKRLVNG